MEGRVSVGGVRADKPGARFPIDADLRVSGPPRPYASRGGVKLAAALDRFGIDPAGLTVLDVGAGTGGFTDCLLKRGAARVVAIDVGHGQIDHSLRTDPRVTVIERLNARALEPSDLPGPADLVVVDVSFISATLILPRLPAVMRGRDVIVLVKPQFEVGRGEVGRGGIVREPAAWRAAIAAVVRGAAAAGLGPAGLIASPISGAEGNREFLLHLGIGGRAGFDLDAAVEHAIAEPIDIPAEGHRP